MTVNSSRPFNLSLHPTLVMTFRIIKLRPVAKLEFRGCGTPESGPFGSNPPHKTPFLAYFVAKSGPFGRFGVVRRTPSPPATGLIKSIHETSITLPFVISQYTGNAGNPFPGPSGSILYSASTTYPAMKSSWHDRNTGTSFAAKAPTETTTKP